MTELNRSAGGGTESERCSPIASGWLVLAALSPCLLLLTLLGPWPWLAALLGRAHPLILHFPIALLLLVAVMEGIEIITRGRFRFAPRLALFAGSFGAVLAAACGYLLMRADAVEGARVERHLWGGVTVATLAVLALVVQSGFLHSLRQSVRYLYRVLLLALCGALVITGHDGSALTHGENYLTEHLPWNVGSVRIAAPKFPTDRPVAQWAAYEQVIAPILQTRCVACHNSTNFKGKLVLDKWEGVARGGKTGPLWEAGKLSESLLVERLLLPPNDEKHMPPKKKLQPSPAEVTLLKLWVQAGAPAQGVPRTLAADQAWLAAATKLPNLLTAAYHLQAAPAEEPPEFDPAKVARARAPVERALTPLRTRFPGMITYLSRESADLRVNASVRGASFGDSALAEIAALREWIVELDVSETGVTDASAAVLATMTRARVLRMNGTAVGDATIAALAPLAQLESIGLFRTAISDASAPALAKLPKLRHVYAAETKMSPATVATLQNAARVLPKTAAAN